MPRARKLAAEMVVSEGVEATGAGRVYVEIKQAILAGELPSGFHLGQEQVARRFGGSRTPTREALWRLISEGLVEVSPGHGARVASVSVQDFIEVNELRLIVEPAAVRKVAESGGWRDGRNMSQRLAAALETEEMDLEKVVKLDFEAHVALAEATGSRRLCALIRNLNEFNSLSRAWDMQRRGRNVLTSMHDILAFAQAGDADQAEEEMRKHISSFVAVLGSGSMDLGSRLRVQ